MKSNLYYFIALLLIIGLVFSCKKESVELECIPTSNPCDSVEVVSAEFTMEEIAGVVEGSLGTELRTETDTAYSNKYIRFHALEEDANYTWHIGAEIYTDRTFYKYFPASYNYQTVPVALRVDKALDVDCSMDNPTDSFSQELTFSRAHDLNVFFQEEYNRRIDGDFRFHDDLIGDSVDIRIERFTEGEDANEFLTDYGHLKFTDINLNGDLFDHSYLVDTLIVRLYSDGYVNFREIIFLDWADNDLFSFRHSAQGEVEFELSIDDFNPDVPPRKFRGRKLN